MTDAVWETPVPSSGFERGVKLRIDPQRTVVLTFEYETPSGEMKTGELKFKNVVSYEQKFYAAISADIDRTYYDRLCEIKNSDAMSAAMNIALQRGNNITLKNYRILFDDGPYLDIICESFDWGG